LRRVWGNTPCRCYPCLPVGIGTDAAEESLVAIQRVLSPGGLGGKFHDLTHGLGVEVHSHERAAVAVDKVGLPGASGGGNGVGAGQHDLDLGGETPSVRRSTVAMPPPARMTSLSPSGV